MGTEPSVVRCSWQWNNGSRGAYSDQIREDIKIADPEALIFDRNQIFIGKTEICSKISTYGSVIFEKSLKLTKISA